MSLEKLGLQIGHAHNENVNTGTTVITANQPFTATVDVRGGAPGTRETDLLAPDKLVSDIDALVLSGGSAYGLQAADGVLWALAKEGRGYAVDNKTVPIVPAAILFDLLNGGDKNFAEDFYFQLGKTAYAERKPISAQGRVGAGFGASTGSGAGGFGIAFEEIGDVVIGAFIAVNAFGSVINQSGQFFGAMMEKNGEFGDKGIPLWANIPESNKYALLKNKNPIQNTTIGAVFTNLNLSKSELKRLCVSGHDGLAVSIAPAHTIFDGDLIFAASTRQLDRSFSPELQIEMSYAIQRATARAVMASVYYS